MLNARDARERAYTVEDKRRQEQIAKRQSFLEKEVMDNITAKADDGQYFTVVQCPDADTRNYIANALAELGYTVTTSRKNVFNLMISWNG